MRSKLKSRLSILFLSLILAIGDGQYSSYSSYSTVPQGETSVSGSVGSTNVNSVDTSSKNVDLTNNGMGDVSSGESVRSNQVSGYNPQAQGSHSMYYYEMYPSPKTGQKCVYSGNGMKCQYRRDSGAVGGHMDSYASAAAQAPSSSYGAPMMHYGSTGYGEEEDGGGGEGGGLSGLAGLVGLLGLKGLKGLKALAPFSIFLPLLPILLPLLPILPIILLGLLLLPLLPLLLFFPIPVIVPGVARSNNAVGINLLGIDGTTSVARMATEVLESEECVERMACEIVRMSKKYNASGWIERVAEFFPKNNRYAMKFFKGMKNEVKTKEEKDSEESAKSKSLNSDCSRFVCKPKSVIAKHFSK